MARAASTLSRRARPPPRPEERIEVRIEEEALHLQPAQVTVAEAKVLAPQGLGDRAHVREGGWTLAADAARGLLGVAGGKAARTHLRHQTLEDVGVALKEGDRLSAERLESLA